MWVLHWDVRNSTAHVPRASGPSLSENRNVIVLEVSDGEYELLLGTGNVAMVNYYDRMIVVRSVKMYTLLPFIFMWRVLLSLFLRIGKGSRKLNLRNH